MQFIQDQLTASQATLAALKQAASMTRIKEAPKSPVQARETSNLAPPPH